MNILFVSDVSIGRVIGGAERVLYEQSTRLAGRGHAVHVLTRRLPEHSNPADVIEGVHEWRYPVRPGHALSYFASSTRNGRILYESLSSGTAFDVVNFHQPFSSCGVLKSPHSRNPAKIYTCHSLSFEEYRSRHPKPPGVLKGILHALNVRARKAIEGRVLRASDRIIVLSSYTRSKILSQYGIFPGNIVLIPGGVDLEKFRPAADRKDLRERLGLPVNRIVLLTVRNLVPRMGLENLIQAMPSVVRRIPDVQLIIGGSGPLKENLVRTTEALGLQAFIRFEGFIPENSLPDYYGASDLFVLPTIDLEGFGLVTLEALASGLPVVGTPVGGTKEILGRLDARYLFSGTDSASIAERIVEWGRAMGQDPSLRSVLSAQCRAFAEEHYDWQRNVDATEKVFSEAVRSG